jgi:hypothetical protein
MCPENCLDEVIQDTIAVCCVPVDAYPRLPYVNCEIGERGRQAWLKEIRFSKLRALQAAVSVKDNL